MTTPLNISLAQSETAFQALAQPWNALVQKCNGSVFLRHEWFDAAWAWRKEHGELFVLVARAGDNVVGILPLIRTRDIKQFSRPQSLEFLTVPDTQLCDLIADPAYRTPVADAFCNALHQRRGDWDVLMLNYADANGIALQEFQHALQVRGYALTVANQGPNLYVALDTTWDTYYSKRSRSLKKANNLAANRLKKTGIIDITWVSRETADDGKTQDILIQAIDISRRSWKQETGNSLDHPGPNRFITTLTKHAVCNGWLSLWLLSSDGKALAMEYQLLDQGNVYALRADFDAQCEDISPGSYLMRNLLETLFSRNLKKYYMGPGENAYKTRWTEENDMLHRMTVYGTTWRGKICRMINESLKPVARNLRDKLRKPTTK